MVRGLVFLLEWGYYVYKLKIKKKVIGETLMILLLKVIFFLINEFGKGNGKNESVGRKIYKIKGE